MEIVQETIFRPCTSVAVHIRHVQLQGEETGTGGNVAPQGLHCSILRCASRSGIIRIYLLSYNNEHCCWWLDALLYTSAYIHRVKLPVNYVKMFAIAVKFIDFLRAITGTLCFMRITCCSILCTTNINASVFSRFTTS